MPNGIACNPNYFRSRVLDRSDHFLEAGIPPLVAHDAVATAVCSREKRGMSGSSMGIDVVVVAVGEIGAMIEEELEPTFAKLVTVALQVVGPKLVNYHHDNQFRAAIVGGRERRLCTQKAQ